MIGRARVRRSVAALAVLLLPAMARADPARSVAQEPGSPGGGEWPEPGSQSGSDARGEASPGGDPQEGSPHRHPREDHQPGRRVSLGAGGGLLVGPRGTGGHLLVETTFTGLFAPKDADWGDRFTFGPNLSLGASLGGGARYLYGEVSGYMLLSLGVGAGYRFATPSPALDSTPAYHLFIGLPIGVPFSALPGPFGLWGIPYLEPYYRAQVGWSAGQAVIHEIGILLRVSFGKGWSISF
jgi:hypothetical protein